MSPRCARRAAVLAAVVAGALGAPAAASAVDVTEYRLELEGKATYTRHLQSRGDLGRLTHTTDDRAVFRFTGQIPKVVFSGDRVLTASAGDRADVDVEEATRVSVGFVEGRPATTTTCRGSALRSPAGPPVIDASQRISDETGRPGIDLRLVSSAAIALDQCTGGSRPDAVLDITSGVEPLGRSAYDAFFELPAEALGAGKVIQLLRRQVAGDACPFRGLGPEDGCLLQWEATVTLTRTGRWEATDGPLGPQDVPLPPAPAPAPAPAPGPGLDPSDVPTPPGGLTEDDVPLPGGLTEDDVPTVPARGRLSPDGRTASARITCPAGCTGTVTVRAAGRGRAGARAAAAAPVLARARVRLAPAPGARTVTVRLGRTAAARARRAGGVQLAFALRGGRGAVRRASVAARRG